MLELVAFFVMAVALGVFWSLFARKKSIPPAFSKPMKYLLTIEGAALIAAPLVWLVWFPVSDTRGAAGAVTIASGVAILLITAGWFGSHDRAGQTVVIVGSSFIAFGLATFAIYHMFPPVASDFFDPIDVLASLLVDGGLAIALVGAARSLVLRLVRR